MRERTSSDGIVDYQVERSNDAWPDHRARTLVTAGLIAWVRPESLLDPACGDGSIALTATRLWPIGHMTLSDISVPNISRIADSKPHPSVSLRTADIDAMMATPQKFQMIVLTEILEHVPDPNAIVTRARAKADVLVASSPAMRKGQQDRNPEHMWQFDEDGYLEMLNVAGWSEVEMTLLAFPHLMYDFQIWVCR